MPLSLLHALDPMLQRLQHLSDFDDGDREAILGLPHRVEALAAHAFIVTEGDPHVSSCVLLSGFAIRHKVAGNGGRQIMALHMVGDLIDLQNALLDVANHNLQTLSPATVAYIPVEAVSELMATRPAVGRAMWRETLIEASIFREWILNIGRRNARTRIAHFLCEIAVRMEAR
ncbi:MAG: Crp/Fnr family transcriptional regulator, partial [Alphaproteobacteria bacterium]